MLGKSKAEVWCNYRHPESWRVWQRGSCAADDDAGSGGSDRIQRNQQIGRVSQIIGFNAQRSHFHKKTALIHII